MKKLVALTLAGSLALGLFLTGCSVEQVSSEPNETVSSSESGADTGDRVLNVCNWGEYIDESLITQFEEESTTRPPRATRPCTPCSRAAAPTTTSSAPLTI